MRSAFAELELIYQELTQHIDDKKLSCAMRGICCDFERADHRLYATTLEIAYMQECAGDSEGVTPLRCPWFKEGRCNARQGRVLGCRAYFCSDVDASADLYEEFFVKIKELHRKWDIEYRYVPVFAYLSERKQDDSRSN